MMALEMMGGRYLYPRFGSSIDVWAAIISVFILSLSIGYWLGGRIADKMKSNKALGIIIVLSGIYYLLLPTFARPFIDMLGESIYSQRWGSLVPAGVHYSSRLHCFWAVSHRCSFAWSSFPANTSVKPQARSHAIGSFGNVLGILVTNYFLLAAFDLNQNCYGMGIALGLTGLAHIFLTMEAQQDSTKLMSKKAEQDALAATTAQTAKSDAEVAEA